MGTKRELDIVDCSDASKRWRVDESLAARSVLLAECLQDARGQITLEFPAEAVDAWRWNKPAGGMSPELLLNVIKVRVLDAV